MLPTTLLSLEEDTHPLSLGWATLQVLRNRNSRKNRRHLLERKAKGKRRRERWAGRMRTMQVPRPSLPRTLPSLSCARGDDDSLGNSRAFVLPGRAKDWRRVWCLSSACRQVHTLRTLPSLGERDVESCVAKPGASPFTLIAVESERLEHSTVRRRRRTLHRRPRSSPRR